MTGIYNNSIDICNSMVLLSTIPTTQQISGVNYLSNVRFKYLPTSTIYDLAQVYKINTTLVTTNPILKIYTNYNSTKTDIGYIFEKPTSGTITSANVSNTTTTIDHGTGNNYTLIRISSALTASPSSTTMVTYTNTVTVTGTVTAYIMVVGPGGYGAGGTGTSHYGGAGGGSVVVSTCNLTAGTYNVKLTSPNVLSATILSYSSITKSDNSINIKAPGGGSTIAGAGGTAGGSGYTTTGTTSYGLNGGDGGSDTIKTDSGNNGPNFPSDFNSTISMPTNMTTAIPNGYYGSGGGSGGNNSKGGAPGTLLGGGLASSVANSLAATSATAYGCGGGCFKNTNFGGLGAFGVVYIYVDSYI